VFARVPSSVSEDGLFLTVSWVMIVRIGLVRIYSLVIDAWKGLSKDITNEADSVHMHTVVQPHHGLRANPRRCADTYSLFFSPYILFSYYLSLLGDFSITDI
jgi:hypothetical protein